MQEMSGIICSAAKVGDEGKLIDKRDNKSYWIMKFMDGKCWMTQNLDYDLDTAKPLTYEDSDVVNWTPTNSTQVGANPNFTTSNYNIVQSWDPAGGGTEKYCANNTTENCDLTSSKNGGHDAQGNYYSWGAATAGQASSLTSTGSQPASQSICPKGWRLPTGGGSGEFYDFDGFTVAQMLASPYYFTYNGIAASSSLTQVGSNGYYWSSMSNNTHSAYSLRLHTNVDLTYSSNRYYGLSVRCVAR